AGAARPVPLLQGRAHHARGRPGARSLARHRPPRAQPRPRPAPRRRRARTGPGGVTGNRAAPRHPQGRAPAASLTPPRRRDCCVERPPALLCHAMANFLAGLRVLELRGLLAGAVSGRALADAGAEVDAVDLDLGQPPDEDPYTRATLDLPKRVH